MASLLYHCNFLCICSSCMLKLEPFVILCSIIMNKYSISKRLNAPQSYLLSVLRIWNQISGWLILHFFLLSPIWMVFFLCQVDWDLWRSFTVWQLIITSWSAREDSVKLSHSCIWIARITFSVSWKAWRTVHCSTRWTWEETTWQRCTTNHT